MTDPYAKGTEKDKWPGQEKSSPIGFPHPGFNADNSDKKAAFLSPTFDGGAFDSPGKGLGQADTGDAIFPSNETLPKGQTDKSTNEDIQLGYPGTAEMSLSSNIQQQIDRTFGAEYREAFDQLANAVDQHKSIEESISIIVSNSDYALDVNVLNHLADKYLI